MQPRDWAPLRFLSQQGLVVLLNYHISMMLAFTKLSLEKPKHQICAFLLTRRFITSNSIYFECQESCNLVALTGLLYEENQSSNLPPYILFSIFQKYLQFSMEISTSNLPFACKILKTKKLSSEAFFKVPFMTAMFNEVILVQVFLG